MYADKFVGKGHYCQLSDMIRPTTCLLYAVSLVLVSCASPNIQITDRPAQWSQKVELNGLSNIYKIDDYVYRSEQPSAKDMATLHNYGIRSVLNLRHVRNDKHEAKDTPLKLYHVPINTWRMSYDDLVKAVAILQTSDKPVLVHCLHGSDRTGCVIAAYRMIHHGWTKEEAIRELAEGGYGYHEKWFPNIVELLHSLDVQKFRKDVDLASSL